MTTPLGQNVVYATVVGTVADGPKNQEQLTTLPRSYASSNPEPSAPPPPVGSPAYNAKGNYENSYNVPIMQGGGSYATQGQYYNMNSEPITPIPPPSTMNNSIDNSCVMGTMVPPTTPVIVRGTTVVPNNNPTWQPQQYQQPQCSGGVQNNNASYPQHPSQPQPIVQPPQGSCSNYNYNRSGGYHREGQSGRKSNDCCNCCEVTGIMCCYPITFCLLPCCCAELMGQWNE